MLPNSFNQRLGRIRAFLPGTGHAGAGNGVDKAACSGGDRCQPTVACRGCDEGNQIHPGGPQYFRDTLRIFINSVSYQKSVNTGRGRIVGQPVKAVSVKRIKIAEQDDRNLSFASQPSNHRKDIIKIRPVRQGPHRGCLYRRPVRHRVGEGNSEFDDVRAQIGQRQNKSASRVKVRVARGDEGNETLAAAAVKLSEFCSDPAHLSRSINVATVFTSLSPRPERLTIMIWSFARPPAILMT